MGTCYNTDNEKTVDMTGYCTLMDRQFNDLPRNIPLKIYLPISNAMLQSPIAPYIGESEYLIFYPCFSLTIEDDPQTMGTALNARMPKLFPSKRTCVLARPLIHGVEVPLKTPLLGLLADAIYPDGFLHVCIVMMS